MIEFFLDFWSISRKERGIELDVTRSRYKKVKFFVNLILVLVVFRYFSWVQIFRMAQNKMTGSWNINTWEQEEFDTLFLQCEVEEYASFFFVLKSIFVLDSFPRESLKLNREITFT